MIRLIATTALCLAALPTFAQVTPAASAASAASPVSPAKKELVQKLLTLQQSGYEAISRGVVERPALQLLQAAGQALQQQVPPEKREAAGKSIEADIKKFVEDAVIVMRERAVRLAPSTFGTMLEDKFTEDEIKQLITWTESPVNKKFQQSLPEAQGAFLQKLVAEAGPLLDPKLQTLQQKVRATLVAATPSAPAASAPAAAPAPKPAKK